MPGTQTPSVRLLNEAKEQQSKKTPSRMALRVITLFFLCFRVYISLEHAFVEIVVFLMVLLKNFFVCFRIIRVFFFSLILFLFFCVCVCAFQLQNSHKILQRPRFTLTSFLISCDYLDVSN